MKLKNKNLKTFFISVYFSSIFLLILLLLFSLFSCADINFKNLGISSESNGKQSILNSEVSQGKDNDSNNGSKSNQSDMILQSDSKDSKEGNTENNINEDYFYDQKSRQTDKNALSNLNVRKAIFFAIDRQRIAKELLGDYGNVLNSIFNNDSTYYYPAWSKYSYDPQKAIQFLKAAGYSKENPLYLTIGTNSDSTSRQKIEEIIKENLKEIGVELWLSNKEPREWFADCLKNGNFELGIWAINTSDLSLINNYFSSKKIPSLESENSKSYNNFYWYTNKDVDTILEKIKVETIPSNVKALSDKLQEILSQDAFFLPLYSRIYAICANKKIKNIEIDSRNGNYFINIEKMDVQISNNKVDSKSKKTSSDTSEVLSSNLNNVSNAENNKSLVCGIQQEPYSLNPFILDSNERDIINSLLVRGLWVRKESGIYEPFLVDSVATGSAGSTEKNDLKLSLKVLIKLKDNIFWQDGTPITSQDVLETINAIQSSDIKNSINSNVNFSIIKNIELLDKKQFLITFSEYSNDWKDLFNVIIPAKLLKDKKIEDLFYDDFFGCGPFKLRQWNKGEFILLERNTFYAGNSPVIDAVQFLFNSDVNYLLDKLKSQDIDIMSVPADLSLFEEIKENDNLNLIVVPGTLWEHLAICLKPKQ